MPESPSATIPRGSVAPLLVGLGVALVGSLLFTGIAYAVFSESLPPTDERVALDMKEAATTNTGIRPLMVALTHIGGVPAMITLPVLGIFWQVYRRRYWFILPWVLVPLSGGLFDLLLKTSFDRPRPPIEWRDPAVTETNESFPSGHAMGSLIGYGMLAYALFLDIRCRWCRAALLLAFALLVAGVGFSRIYLRAHWFSDVLGGFAIGAAWLGLWLGILEWYRRRREAECTTTSTSS